MKAWAIVKNGKIVKAYWYRIVSSKKMAENECYEQLGEIVKRVEIKIIK